MYWLEVSLTVDEETAELVSEILRPFAQDESVVLEQLGDAVNLDPDALEPDVTVKIYIPGDEDSPAFRGTIEAALATAQSGAPIPAPKYKKLEEADWANAWKENYKPFRVGEHFWIQPSWLEVDEPSPEDVLIVLDPGMAFGTGTHETTQLCLTAVEQHISSGDRVLDVGTGSGILAIGSAKLGAVEVTALDTDRHAVKATIENGRLNGVDHLISAYQGSLATVSPRKGHWDLILVNILAPVIVMIFEQEDLMDYLAPDGRLILSGIIMEQIDVVEQAVQRSGGRVLDRLTIGDWVALVVGRN